LAIVAAVPRYARSVSPRISHSSSAAIAGTGAPARSRLGEDPRDLRFIGLDREQSCAGAAQLERARGERQYGAGQRVPAD
jgi:hypothetical protein